jgi:hypothetical protein
VKGAQAVSVKKLLDEFSRDDTSSPDTMDAQTKLARVEIEKRLIRINRCFAEIILPALFEVENDLNQAGFWNQMHIGQSTSLESGKPNIKETALCFYPERTDHPPKEPEKMESAAYRARIRASGNLRELHFSIQFPKRIPTTVEVEEETLGLDEIDTDQVNAFLEKFVKGALDAYNSDRMLF